MAISITKYVDIKSAINNIKTATEKDLIARIFTTKILNPNKVFEFESADEVGNFFGFETDEYTVAQRYFDFVNKYARSPKKISYYEDWREGSPVFIEGALPADLTALQAITSGAIKITIGDISETLTDIDLSSATKLSDVATILQTALRASNEDESFASAIVGTDDRPIGTIIIITSGTVGRVPIAVETANDSSLREDLGFIEEGQQYEEGRPTGTITEVFADSYQISNNFATLAFLSDMTTTEIKNLGEYIESAYPSEFMFVVPVNSSNKSTIQEEVADIDGVSLELCEADSKYNFYLPMAITATTDYNKENGTVDYMYTQAEGMEVVVDTDSDAKTYDELKINYYGRTQQAGQKLAFYQNGVLQGNYQDQNIFVNEIWLKDALTTKYINYMLLTSNWYANKAGQAIGQGLAMSVIDRAKLNGTITTEKEISEADKVYIYNITSDENAWRQIYQEGYYIVTSIDKKTINNQETYVFNYTLLYSKGDSIRKVEGKNILI